MGENRNWMDRMNAVVNYIETHLEDEVDMAEVSALGGCSAYHFQRVFFYMANITMTDYIRRRRLTKAALDLQGGHDKVIDIAMKYGYDSPTAFARAFAALHGISPSQAKESGQALLAYPPLSFQISILGGNAMNYRIEEHGPMRVLGYKLHTSLENDQQYQAIPAFWGEVHAQGGIPKLCALMEGEPMGVLGISAITNWETAKEMDYFVAVASGKAPGEGMETMEIPACTWAIFECVGPMPVSIQELSRRIMTEWLPNSGYEYADAPDIEQYSDGDQSAPDYKSWIWLPIRKAK